MDISETTNQENDTTPANQETQHQQNEYKDINTPEENDQEINYQQIGNKNNSTPNVNIQGNNHQQNQYKDKNNPTKTARFYNMNISKPKDRELDFAERLMWVRNLFREI